MIVAVGVILLIGITLYGAFKVTEFIISRTFRDFQ